MPPCLDIYALSPRRDRETIGRFLDAYCDRAASDDLFGGGSEVEVYTADMAGQEGEWKSAEILDHAIALGLEHPDWAFCLYLKSVREDIYQVMLAFTTDGHVVFGVSVDEEDESDASLDVARRLMRELAAEYEAILGVVLFEMPPAQDEASFRAYQEEALAYWEGGS